MHRVAIVGSVNVDLTVTSGRVAMPGETITGDDYLQGLGGKGANQAVAAARAGAPTAFVGCAGDDAFGELVAERLAEAGVETEHLLRAAGSRTGIAHIRVADGENSIVVVPLANALVSAEQARAALADLGGGVLLTQLEIDPTVTEAALAAGRAGGWTTILDPAPAIELPASLWQHVDIVKPNEHEAELLTGVPVVDVDGAERAASWFHDRGVPRVIVTMGGRGVVRSDARGVRSFAAPSVTPVDTTAAGDTFSGYLAASLATGADLDDAIASAMAASAIAVTRLGASASIPERSEVDAAQAAARG